MIGVAQNRGDRSTCAGVALTADVRTLGGALTGISPGMGARMIGETMDITERKRAERAYNTQILNAAADGILDYCRLHDILVQAWAPVANGTLIDPPKGAEANVRKTASLVALLLLAAPLTTEA